MKFEILFFGILGLMLYNIYNDYKITKLIFKYKKYLQLLILAFFGIILYIMIKRQPSDLKKLLYYTNNTIKYLPINKSSVDMLSPILDFTRCNVANNNFMYGLNKSINDNYNPELKLSQREIYFPHTAEKSDNCVNNRKYNLYSNDYLNDSKKITKRSVSETKKKYVASRQEWKCGNCREQLKHTFEIDHKVRLDNGGNNDVSNLVALCRECHGMKTSMENM